jgi:hypothetical protein
VPIGRIRAAERYGITIKHTMPRKKHPFEVVAGVVRCAGCDVPCVRLPNGGWVCPAEEAQALRGIERQAAIRIDHTKVPPKPEKVQTDADLGMSATKATREYTTLRGIKKGGPPVLTGAELDAAIEEDLFEDER